MALTKEMLDNMTQDEVDALVAKYPHLDNVIEKLKEDSNE